MPQLNIDGFANMGWIPFVFQPQGYSDAEHEYGANVNWLKGTHDPRAARTANGFQRLVSYTWSKALGYANTSAANGATGTPPVAIRRLATQRAVQRSSIPSRPVAPERETYVLSGPEKRGQPACFAPRTDSKNRGHPLRSRLGAYRSKDRLRADRVSPVFAWAGNRLAVPVFPGLLTGPGFFV